MGKGTLSQAEIDLLLNPQNSLMPKGEAELSAVEVDALGEIGNISLGSGATTLSMLLGHPVQITTPGVAMTTRRILSEEYPVPCVAIEVRYTDGLEGSNLLIVKETDARVMVDLMMGGDGTGLREDLDEMHFSALGEAMNQMMGATATAMSTLFRRRINISPPSLELVKMSDTDDLGFFQSDAPLIRVSFRMTIGTLVDSEIIQLIPFQFGRKSVDMLLQHVSQEGAATPGSLSSGPAELSFAINTGPTIRDRVSSQEKLRPAEPEVLVQPAIFQPLKPKKGNGQDANLDLILDVSLTLTVELGRTQRQIRDILTLGIGSVVELDKLAGEPVEVLVNGKLIAKGEVVVIDESFGIRITEIVSITERVNKLQ